MAGRASMNNFKNKKIAIVGSGVEGQSSAKYLKKHGADVTILDKTQGDDYLKDLDKYDLIVRSPGVKLSEFQKSKIKNQKSKITSQTNLFLELAPCKIIGVTGTKGKGTTSSLICEMLKKQGFDAYLGGNIGVPPFEFLDKLNTHSVVVLELSSFQLMDVKKSPQIAVMLMTTSEHLDYHNDVNEYVDAKRNILKFQTQKDFTIVNRDYPASNESDIHTDAKVFYVSTERDGYEGCFIKNGEVILSRNGEEKKVINTSQILLPGKHNLENVCAASMASYLSGVSIENIASVLKTFKGLEHRLELVATVNGVKYYDDSFSTTPETAMAAINAFEAPEILVLGGSSKNSNFSELGHVISEAPNIKVIIGIGKEWQRIKAQLRIKNSELIMIEGATNMNQIVQAAYKIAAPGDVILLTPACASFDMFKNYKDRGEQFKNEVLKLKS
nr:UDP-N-acetylmuramoyl-L-alanine--D-glutamate ligase [Candidatus Levybacteria bacterium]